MPICKDLPRKDNDVNDYISAWIFFYCVREGIFLEDNCISSDLLIANNEYTGHTIQKIKPIIGRAKAALWDHMYDNLTILDGKARALLSSTSILTAILGWLFVDIHDTWSRPVWTVVTMFVVIFSLLSIALSVSVFRVCWSTPDDYRQPTLDSLVRRVVRTRSGRTLRYRVASFLHYLVIAYIIIIVIVKSVDKYV